MARWHVCKCRESTGRAPKDKGVAKCDTLGATQTMTFINESGLYSTYFFCDDFKYRGV